jgi:hypothetical protein
MNTITVNICKHSLDKEFTIQTFLFSKDKKYLDYRKEENNADQQGIRYGKDRYYNSCEGKEEPVHTKENGSIQRDDSESEEERIC